jgi:hypothetical protein
MAILSDCPQIEMLRIRRLQTGGFLLRASGPNLKEMELLKPFS